MPVSLRILVLLAPIGIIVSCGGGGSSGGSITNPAASAEITSGNATTIASAALSAAMESGELDELGGASLFGVTPMVQVQAATSVNGPIAAVTVGPETVPCGQSGNMTVTATIDDPNTLSTGDSIFADFNNCSNDGVTTLSGGLDFVVRLFQGDILTEMFAMTIDVDLLNMEFTDGNDSASMDGDFRLGLDTTGFPVIISSVSGDSLTLSLNNETMSMEDFSSSVTVDGSTFPETLLLDASGFLMSSEFDGQLGYEITASFQSAGTGDPSTGTMLISGANGATITANIVSSQTVELQIDLDGDEVVDEIVITSWAELDS